MQLYKKGSQGEMVRQIQRALKLLPDGIFGQLTEDRVREFQTQHRIKPDGIVGPVTLALLLPAVIGLKKSTRRITEIIVHCTASPEGQDRTVYDIRRDHKAQGWSDIGYHYVVYRNGLVVPGRDVNIIGSHCVGHNSHSIGVAYVGGVARDGKTAKDTRTLSQKAALLGLLEDLRSLYPDAKIHGHRDFANKDCPSFDATKEYRNL